MVQEVTTWIKSLSSARSLQLRALIPLAILRCDSSRFNRLVPGLRRPFMRKSLVIGTSLGVALYFAALIAWAIAFGPDSVWLVG